MIRIILLLLPFLLSAESVIVSVAPYKFFVEKIAGNTVDVIVLVPANASPHSYEPPPKLIMSASQASIWFKIGESFETKAIQALKAYNKKLTLVDLRQGLSLIAAPHHHHEDGSKCCHGGEDLHIWLSLRMAKIEAETIAKALIERFPENKELYQTNLQKFLVELSDLDQEITRELYPLRGKTVFVSHPAYAYFCRDYGLTQLSIEFEGREPTPRAMIQLYDKVKTLGIKTIFIQPQYGAKGAELFARDIGAKIVSLDPYAEDYLRMMRSIGLAFKDGL